MLFYCCVNVANDGATLLQCSLFNGVMQNLKLFLTANSSFFTSFITKQLQGYVHIHIQIQGYIQTLTYLIFYITNFVDMLCIFFIPAAHQYLFLKYK